MPATNESRREASQQPDLLDFWALPLRAERYSPQTVNCYASGVTRYPDYCAEYDLPVARDRMQRPRMASKITIS